MINLIGFISFVIGLTLLFIGMIFQIDNLHSYALIAYSIPAGIFAGNFIITILKIKN